MVAHNLLYRLNQREIHYRAHLFSHTSRNVLTVHKNISGKKVELLSAKLQKSAGPAKNIGGNCLFSRSVSFGP